MINKDILTIEDLKKAGKRALPGTVEVVGRYDAFNFTKALYLDLINDTVVVSYSHGDEKRIERFHQDGVELAIETYNHAMELDTDGA